MIRHSALVRLIRDRDYSFKGQTKRVEVYKQRGSTHRILIGRRKKHDITVARKHLKDAGYTDYEIQEILEGLPDPDP